MSRILVTGANGFIGTALVQRLAARGDAVTCLVRQTSKNTEPLVALGARLFYGSLTDRAALAAALEGQEVVYHVAGCMRVLRRQHLFEVNEQGTRYLAECAAATASPPVFVFVSSLAAAGSAHGDRPRVESDPPRPVSNYGHSKLAGERALVDVAGTLPATIIRPPIVLGEGDAMGLVLFRSVSRFRVHLIPSYRRRKYSVVHVADLVELLLLAAEQGERLSPSQEEHHCGQGIYFAAAECHPTYAELGRMIAAALGRWMLPAPVPQPAIWSLAAGVELVGRIRGRAGYLNLDKAREIAAGSWLCSKEKAHSQLGFAPAAPLDERLRQAAAWYRAAGWL